MVVSVTEPKLLMKMLQVTFTGGPKGSKAQPYWQGIPGGWEKVLDSLPELEARALLEEGSASYTGPRAIGKRRSF